MKTTELYAYVQTALNSCDDLPLAALVRRVLRVARLQGDVRTAIRFALESRGIGGGKAVHRREAADLARGLGPATPTTATDETERLRQLATEEWIQDRKPEFGKNDAVHSIVEKDSIIAGSVAEIEDRVAWQSEEAALAHDFPSGRIQLRLRRTVDIQILNRIRHRAFLYLSGVERDLAFASVAADVFELHRRRVDAHLQDLAPEISEQFVAVHSALDGGAPEGLSQALTSCRRVLKSVADIAYAPRDEKVSDQSGKMRDVGPEQYINRIMMFIATAQPRTTGAALLHATIEGLGARLTALNDLACKGVHAEVSVGEARAVVMQTYLVAGEVLELVHTPRAST